MYGTTITVTQLVALLTGVLLPILINLVNTETIPGKWKSLQLLVLSGVSAVLTQLATGHDDWQQVLWTTTTAFIIGVASLFGLWKPTGVHATTKLMGVTTRAARGGRRAQPGAR